jgi:hypothetical protein
MLSAGLRFVALVSCSALLAGCAGASATSTPASAVLPASSSTAAVGEAASAGWTAVSAPSAAGARRRPLVTSNCTGSGSDSFLGDGGDSNLAVGVSSVVVGGVHDQACDDFGSIVGGYYDIIQSASNTATYSFIGGGYSNGVQAGEYSTIAGGLANTMNNAGGGTSSTIGGGAYNTVNSSTSTIAGGGYNSTAGNVDFVGGGAYNAAAGDYSAIGAGEHNTTSNTGAYIGGGGYNTASGEGAIVDGGFEETASGTFSTIPGGYRNSAGGTYSFAAGALASAVQTGTFVWSDGSNGSTALTSSRAYQFLARASGGFTLYTNAGATVGAQLAAGSGAWASLSDRNAKTNIVPLDDDTVLAKVASLPISRWSYRTEHGVRHVGPMAQDFYAAFKVGEDDKHITSIDEDGVALAAIKALHGQNAALRADNATLHADVKELRGELAALRALVTARASK